MAARTSQPEKRPGFLATIKSLFSFTREEFAWVTWVLPLIVLGGIGIGVAIAVFTGQPWWGYILWVFFGIMLGFIFGMLLLNRLATKAMYRKIDGMPGGAGHVIGNMLGRKWRGEDMPVQVNPKTQDAVYRAVGRGGVVLVGEGSRGRLEKLVKKETTAAKRITHGAVPVEVFYIGHGEGDTPVAELAKAIKKLPKVIDKAGMQQLIARTDSINQNAMSSMPIPKGIDPMKVRAPKPR
ncbi:DUF4191 family protein [Microbacterium amylolyticum]|uniref:DUF4191 domain-containing protein n=1 Tax=Microbacterium amylolyticum TaxID=936337 RepID=A0ABS4ZEM2_9MICO|nr:DUF4191 family protein [Microbacterium amylolyticum]MBP2435468.1 hypothetical protein [Microbacterium amylolyticum]